LETCQLFRRQPCMLRNLFKAKMNLVCRVFSANFQNVAWIDLEPDPVPTADASNSQLQCQRGFSSPSIATNHRCFCCWDELVDQPAARRRWRRKKVITADDPFRLRFDAKGRREHASTLRFDFGGYQRRSILSQRRLRRPHAKADR